MKKNPNIIVIKTDEHRYDLLSSAGHPVIKTPHLDRLAGRGVSFKNLFTVSPICVPSRSSFFSGQYTHRNDVGFNNEEEHLGVDQWSFMQALHEQGYRLGLAGKNHAFQDELLDRYFDFREETWHWGKIHGKDIREADVEVSKYLSQDPRQGFEDAFGMLEGLVEGPMPFDYRQCPNYRIAEDGLAFLNTLDDRPFFLHYSFADPHWPTVAPEPFYSMYEDVEVELEALEMTWASQPDKHFIQSRGYEWHKYSHEEKQRILKTYYAQISFADHAIGLLLDDLEQKQLMDDTVILFTSDHGCWGGRYGMVGKTTGFNESLLRIPGILVAPGFTESWKGQEIVSEMSNIDLMPTIFDLYDMPYPELVQGRSFKSILQRETDDDHSFRDAIYAEVCRPTGYKGMELNRETYDETNRENIREQGHFWFGKELQRGRCNMIRKKGWKYCFHTNDKDELYNLIEDPYEMNNLIDDPQHRTELWDLKDQLIEWLSNEPLSLWKP